MSAVDKDGPMTITKILYRRILYVLIAAPIGLLALEAYRMMTPWSFCGFIVLVLGLSCLPAAHRVEGRLASLAVGGQGPHVDGQASFWRVSLFTLGHALSGVALAVGVAIIVFNGGEYLRIEHGVFDDPLLLNYLGELSAVGHLENASTVIL